MASAVEWTAAYDGENTGSSSAVVPEDLWLFVRFTAALLTASDGDPRGDVCASLREPSLI
jgi:hypothetical protein